MEVHASILGLSPASRSNLATSLCGISLLIFSMLTRVLLQYPLYRKPAPALIDFPQQLTWHSSTLMDAPGEERGNGAADGRTTDGQPLVN